MLTPGGGGHVSATDKKSLDGGVLGGAVDVGAAQRVFPPQLRMRNLSAGCWSVYHSAAYHVLVSFGLNLLFDFFTGLTDLPFGRVS